MRCSWHILWFTILIFTYNENRQSFRSRFNNCFRNTRILCLWIYLIMKFLEAYSMRNLDLTMLYKWLIIIFLVEIFSTKINANLLISVLWIFLQLFTLWWTKKLLNLYFFSFCIVTIFWDTQLKFRMLIFCGRTIFWFILLKFLFYYIRFNFYIHLWLDCFLFT